MSNTPLTFLFKDDGAVPNNPALPALVYKSAIDVAASQNPERTIEKQFAANGWGRGQWRNGIYPFVHYHSTTHEVLGIARGRAKVRFGGERGEDVDLTAGDVVVLPAGTGHQCLWASSDVLVIGA